MLAFGISASLKQQQEQQHTTLSLLQWKTWKSITSSWMIILCSTL